jgi:hypothetical protein
MNGEHRSTIAVSSVVRAVAFVPPSGTLVSARTGLMLIELSRVSSRSFSVLVLAAAAR